ncbi:hypothetical protein Tco_1430527 [Tanacetum coccineum]
MRAMCGTIVLVFQRTFATIIDHEVSSLAISSYIPARIVSLADREVLKLRFRFLTTKVLGVEGAQGDHEVEVFQVSIDDTTVAQRWLEDKQPEEKTNMDCFINEQEKEY